MKTEIGTKIQILPGSQPGKIKVVGPKAEADYWLPRIRQDREKIKAVTSEADDIIHRLLSVARYYECTTEETSAMLNIAARDPVNAARCFQDIAARLEFS